jgi:multidrug resistance efflux pump
MHIPTQSDRAFLQLVLAEQTLGVLAQLRERGLPDIRIGVAAQVTGPILADTNTVDASLIAITRTVTGGVAVD